MSVTFSFNEITKDWIQVLPSESRWMAPLMDQQTFRPPNMHGAHKGKKTFRPRVLQVPVGIWHDGFEDLQAKKAELSEWLITDDSEILAFSDEPNMHYQASLSTPLSNIVESPNYTTGVLEFTCYIPFRLAREETDIILTAGDNQVTYNGSKSLNAWQISATLTSATNHVEISHLENGRKVNFIFNFQPGDNILIDSRRRKISINGSINSPSFDFENSRWFELSPGNNTIATNIPGATLTFRERWI